jgi:hypothetical protein
MVAYLVDMMAALPALMMVLVMVDVLDEMTVELLVAVMGLPMVV